MGNQGSANEGLRRGVEIVHAGAIGIDGGYGSPNPGGWSNERAEVYFLLVNSTALADFGIAPNADARWDHLLKGEHEARVAKEDLPRADTFEPFHPLDYWRFGAEVIIPSVQFGLYFNFGQLIDFVAGIGTFDPAGDDGVSFFDTYNIPVDSDGNPILEEQLEPEMAVEG